MREEPRWLTLDMVLAIHDEQLARFGGAEGLRDRGLLESALARPINRFHYDPEASPYEFAAALGSGIVGTLAFVDGNRRTGLISMQVFLALNGKRLDAEPVEALMTLLALAAGDIDEAALARWIARNAQPARPGRA